MIHSQPLCIACEANQLLHHFPAPPHQDLRGREAHVPNVSWRSLESLGCLTLEMVAFFKRGPQVRAGQQLLPGTFAFGLAVGGRETALAHAAWKDERVDEA